MTQASENERNAGRMAEAVDSLKRIANKLEDSLSIINGSIIELNCTLKGVSAQVEKHIANDDLVHERLNRRLGSLEGSRNKVLGMAAGISIVGTWLAGWLAKLFGGTHG